MLRGRPAGHDPDDVRRDHGGVSRDGRLRRADAGVALKLGAALALFAVLYFGTPPAGLRLCGFQWLTGRPCPLCGLTRAMFALGKGRWTEALRFHALAPLAVVMLAALLWRGHWGRRLWTVGLAAFAAYGVWRIFAQPV